MEPETSCYKLNGLELAWNYGWLERGEDAWEKDEPDFRTVCASGGHPLSPSKSLLLFKRFIIHFLVYRIACMLY